MVSTNLEIIFSRKSFYVDEVDANNLDNLNKKRFKNFLADKFQAFYDLSFDEFYKGESPSFRFLHFLSENFLEILSASPELEIARENLSLILDETNKTRLLNAVPFALGSEYIDGDWLDEILQELLKKMSKMGGDISFLEALRLESRLKTSSDDSDEDLVYTNGRWLEELMKKIRCPEIISKPEIPATVHADLRPYQKTGYAWLRTMADLKFGSCLADDMGLGKTLQVLTFLDDLRTKKDDAKILSKNWREYPRL